MKPRCRHPEMARIVEERAAVVRFDWRLRAHWPNTKFFQRCTDCGKERRGRFLLTGPHEHRFLPFHDRRGKWRK